MKTYIAIYSDENFYKDMTDSSYTSKKKFANDLKANGYKVVAIFTPEKIAEIKADEHALTNNLNLSERCIAYIKECMSA